MSSSAERGSAWPPGRQSSSISSWPACSPTASSPRSLKRLSSSRPAWPRRSSRLLRCRPDDPRYGERRAVGLWGTVVFMAIDIVLLRPFRAYPRTWDAVGEQHVVAPPDLVDAGNVRGLAGGAGDSGAGGAGW
jgi:hypothetical protein